MQTKICLKCNEEKELSEFHKSITGKLGVYHYCKECCAIKNKINYIKNKKRINDNNKKRHTKHKNDLKYKESRLNTRFKNLYGITLDQYNQMYKEQNGLCAICGKPELVIHPQSKKVRALGIDHNHQTGKVRGLLCGVHNQMIGLAKENIQIFEKAINYLKERNNV